MKYKVTVLCCILILFSMQLTSKAQTMYQTADILIYSLSNHEVYNNVDSLTIKCSTQLSVHHVHVTCGEFEIRLITNDKFNTESFPLFIDIKTLKFFYAGRLKNTEKQGNTTIIKGIIIYGFNL